MGKFCDADCDVIFRKNNVHVVQDPKAVTNLLTQVPTLLHGKRNQHNRLWDTTLPQDPYPIHHISTAASLPPGHPAIYRRRAPQINTVMEITVMKSLLP